jgi:hypothetical protein
MPVVSVRLRRDFAALLNLIRAHAILHQATRQRAEDGCIVATLADYSAVRELVAALFAEGLEQAVSESIRETVRTVAELTSGAGDQETTVAAVAGRLKLDKSSASRRIRQALERGFLVNLEERKGRPHRLRVGDPLPDDTPVLPRPTELERCSVAVNSGGATPPAPSMEEMIL